MPEAVVLAAEESWQNMTSTIRRFSISANNKGLWCPFKATVCQEGYCRECQIYLDWQKAKGSQECYETENKGL